MILIIHRFFSFSISNYSTVQPVRVWICTLLHTVNFWRKWMWNYHFLGANSTQIISNHCTSRSSACAALHAASHGCEATPIRCQWPIPWHAPVPPSRGTPSSSLVRKVHRKVRKGQVNGTCAELGQWNAPSHTIANLKWPDSAPHTWPMSWHIDFGWLWFPPYKPPLALLYMSSLRPFPSHPKSKTSSKSVEQTCRILSYFRQVSPSLFIIAFQAGHGRPHQDFHTSSRKSRKQVTGKVASKFLRLRTGARTFRFP